MNLLAERYQTQRDDVEARIQAANVALEEEKNTLAALVTKFTQGIVVCNQEGKILLYNQQAQELLEQTAKSSVGWLGLGRSVYGVLDESLIKHALLHIQHRLARGDTQLSAPFVAPRTGGRLLSIHLVPVLDKHRAQTGYILTLLDITQHALAENRVGALLRSLTEGQRSSIASIRAAIEMILEYPDMDSERLQQFQHIIRDEALQISQHLESAMAEHADDFKPQWSLEEISGSDLLATIAHRFRETFGITLEVTAAEEPVRLKVDSYAMIRALSFVVEHLIKDYQAERIRLKLECQWPFACLALLWRGAMLDMETFRSWGQQALLADDQGEALTLQDLVEHQGGAVWTQIEEEQDVNAVRILLPARTVASEQRPPRREHDTPDEGDDTQHFYDFRIFDRPEQYSALNECSLSDLYYTVLDTETTGLNPSAGDEIISLAAVRIVHGRVLKREVFDCLVNPRRFISEAAIAIHGISNAQLKDKPTLGEVLPRFHQFVEDTVLVGHNIAFDMRFLELKETSTGIRFNNPVLDTLLLAYVVHPNQEDNSLEAIAARLGIPVGGRHTALGDTLTTAEMFLALIPLLAERGIRTLGQASAACKNSEFARLQY